MHLLARSAIPRSVMRHLLLALAMGGILFQGTAQAVPGGIAATVNGTAISRAELDDALRLARFMSPDAADGELKTETLRNLMRRTAAVQEAARRGITAEFTEVDDRIAALRERFGTREQFFGALAQHDLSMASLQQQVEKDILVAKLIQAAVTPQVHISDDDVRYFYGSNPEYFAIPEKIRVRHILLRVPETAEDNEKKAVRERIETLRELILSGADFAAVAMDHSEDSSAENGGDIGFFAREDVSKRFADAAFILEPGAVSEVVATPLGYHLIQMVERAPESRMPFEQVREPLKRYLHRTATSLSAKVFLDGLLSTSDVQQFVK